jgi:hypothetical protein
MKPEQFIDIAIFIVSFIAVVIAIFAIFRKDIP